MGARRVFLPAAIVGLLYVGFGDAHAHGFSAAPSFQLRTSSVHAHGGYFGGRGGNNTVHYRNGGYTFFYNQGVAVGPGISVDGSRSIPEMPVKSNDERYREATGRVLPAEHGVLALAPTSPTGDPTYLWATSDTR